MFFLLVCYAAGALTVFSPCILPVAPFVLIRSGTPWRRGTLPMLAGLAAAFAAAAALSATGAAWAAEADETGRWAALVLLSGVGLTLVSSRAAEMFARPFVKLGDRLNRHATPDGVGGAFVIGVATGLLWTPCAGPVLALVLTGGVFKRQPLSVALAAFAYAAGAATALALALSAGRKLIRPAARWLRFGERLRQGVGVATIAAACAIAVSADATVLTRLAAPATERIESALLAAAKAAPGPAPSELPALGPLPGLDGATDWLNGAPVTAAALRGKVVLVQVWTYSCINCLRTLPYLRAWTETYRNRGLVVIGVHAPEFAFERNADNVRRAVARLGVAYPVALDNGFQLWRRLGVRGWPTVILADAQGRLRYRESGEGREAETETVLRQLLAKAGAAHAAGPAPVSASGEQAAADWLGLRSRETYLGYTQATGYRSREAVAADRPAAYSADDLPLNRWALSGAWTVTSDRAIGEEPGAIVYRFAARDLHLVLSPAKDGRPVRFQVTLDGRPPGRDHGSDIGEDGVGVVTQPRPYQIIRQAEGARERRFEVRFLDPGVQAYAFTFG